MKTILLILISLATFGQIGAKVNSSSGSGIQGEWVNTQFGYEMKLSLKAGGKGVFDEENISYTVSGNKLIIRGQDTNESYTYKLSGNNLTLSGGDLDDAITFAKSSKGSITKVGEASTETAKTVSVPKTENSKLEKLLGQWTTEGADLEFKANGKGMYNGSPFTYTLNGNTLTSRDQTGEHQFFVMFVGKALTVMGEGTNATFVRGHAGYKNTASAGNNSAGNANSGGGSIDQSIAGKWCYVSSLTNPNASSSSSRCININANGTYTYQAESSISGYGGGYYGGSSSQSADSGTWRLAGNRIYVNSRNEGQKVYSFEKRNHPKNGDPMIIIDGDAYVTYYQRRPW
ncbi:MAG: hypothetical protein LCH67_18580 [Bacteroidetes bacterium]|nr:hypothetical protein [Bacteroidota bacterium]